MAAPSTVAVYFSLQILLQLFHEGRSSTHWVVTEHGRVQSQVRSRQILDFNSLLGIRNQELFACKQAVGTPPDLSWNTPQIYSHQTSSSERTCRSDIG